MSSEAFAIMFARKQAVDLFFPIDVGFVGEKRLTLLRVRWQAEQIETSATDEG